MKKYVLMISAFALAGQLMAQTKAKPVTPTKLKVNAAPVVTTKEPEKPILTIDGISVYKDEFEAIFKKNNPKNSVIDRKALDEYAELFINFKLKVREAEKAGLDTLTSFKEELKGYRRQLAQPYLMDKDVNDKLIQEAYDRSKTDVKASHVLIKLNPEPSPKDSLEAYNKAMMVRDRAVKGENFANLARQFSTDPSAAQNGGDLGYFTSMMMVYPFESAAYNTPVGQISMPVRTKYGYHIIKVEDKRAARGQVRVAHIVVRVPAERDSTINSITKDADGKDVPTSKTIKVAVGKNDKEDLEALKKINEIADKVSKGEDFADLAQKFSDDRTSGRSGGQLAWFGTGRMVPEFESVAFDLKNVGDVSKPFRTSFGYHIVKLLDKKGIQSFDEVKGDLKMKIQRDSRAQISRDVVINRVKKESNFKEDAKAYAELLAKIDTSYISGKWNIEKAKSLNKFLFSIGNTSFTQQDLSKFLADNQSKQTNKEATVESLVRTAYTGFQDDKIIAFEDSQLEDKYKDFRLLMQEYRDGILLFEITDENVWSKALEDTTGLREFYNANMKNYMWDQRVDATIFKAKDDKVAKSAIKMIEKQKKSGTISVENITKEINKKSSLDLQTESGVFAKGENDLVDGVEWKEGISPKKNLNNQIVFVSINKVLPPQSKAISEAKGTITADYQTFLEKQWLETLRAKYKVEINRDVLYSIQ